MMRFIRQVLGCSRREAEADEMRLAYSEEYQKGMRQQRAKVIVLERLVAELQKDTTQW